MADRSLHMMPSIRVGDGLQPRARATVTVTTECFGSLTIDRDAVEVRLNGDVISLTKTEFLLLDALTRTPRRAMTNESLFWAVWGSDWVDDGTLQTQISRLRSKLGESGSAPRMIVTVHGFGYRFEPFRASMSQAMADGARSLAESDVGVVIMLVALDCSILWISPSVRPILGYAPEELVGTSVFALGHPEDVETTAAAATELDSGHPAGWMSRIRAHDRSFIPTEALVQPILDAGGKAVAFLGQWRPRSTM
jgi:PAS domain S-box-containing protein